ncbi:hypothetical protein H9P43_005347 [Blastocladiella emersonii ATCC 22665]|nr:hypothetical protein H9P43_005347 [Blastocladiella emersonii ATCC 22665]
MPRGSSSRSKTTTTSSTSTSGSSSGAYYAVQRGRKTGVFTTWAACEAQVKGFSGPVFKKFTSHAEAAAFASGSGVSASTSRSSGTSSSSSSRSTPYSRPTPSTSKLSSSSSADPPVHYAVSAWTFDPTDLVQPTTARRTTATISGAEYAASAFPSAGNGGKGPTVVYTDGSCMGNGQRGGRAGIGAYFGPGDSRNISRPLRLLSRNDEPSNQKAEIQAVTEALKLVPVHEDVVIKTDSQYVVKAWSSWMHSWRRNDYAGVSNVEYFKDLDEQLNRRTGTLRIEYIKAHAGLPGNEAADELAKGGARQYS